MEQKTTHSSDREKALMLPAFLLFSGLFFLTSAFHEPWLDEAQSWLIARDASYHDMIFVLPHLEGHPPFWWLLLSLPAKAGAPYELSLTLVSGAVYMLLTGLILFKSPFPAAVRLLLPLSYHIFYGYGVIARPYGLCLAAFALMAMTFSNRDRQPFAYILANILACSTSAFAVILCGGLAVCWCLEIAADLFRKKHGILKDRRIYALLLLLVFALAEIYMFIPLPDTFTVTNTPLTPGAFLHGLYYMLFMLPADVLFFASGMGLGSQVKLSSFSAPEYICLTGATLMLYLFLLRLLIKKGRVKELVIPALFLGIFGAGVYFYPHHEGMAAVLYLFLLWVCFGDSTAGHTYLEKGEAGEMMDRLGKYLLVGALAFESLWSAADIAKDVRENFYYSREAAAYLRETGLYELNIMPPFYENEAGECISTNKQEMAAAINPYFEKNIFYTLNGGSEGYIIHSNSDEINRRNFEQWRSTVPDVLVGEPDLAQIYGEGGKVKKTDYILVKTIPFSQIVKMNGHTNYISIYLRRDLFSEYPGVLPQNEQDRQLLEEWQSSRQ